MAQTQESENPNEKAWSRRIDNFNRLLYDVIDGKLFIYSCRGHYEDK